MTAAAAALIVTATHATGSGVPLPSPESQGQRPDTTVRSATKSLIESFGDLSRTAGKLSETALKLLEAQEQLDEKARRLDEKERRQTRNGVYIEDDGQPPLQPKEKTRVSQGNGVYIGEDELPASKTSNGVYIGEEETPAAGTLGGVHAGSDTPEEPYVKESAQERADSTDGTLRSLWDLPQEGSEDGQYVWVPADKKYVVQSALDGTIPTAGAKPAEPDLNEMTYWRGDSIHMAIHTKQLGRYDRKLYNWLIYPRGQWHIGLSANYGELSTKDSEFLSLIDDVNLGGKIYSIKPSASYFLRNNLCLGLRLAYTKGQMDIDSFNMDIMDDMNFNLHDIKYLSENYSAALFLQQYFGLSRRGRFAVYNEVEFAIGAGNTSFTRPFGGEIRETTTKTRRLNINYSPGVSVLVMKNAAINVSFGVFGFHVTKNDQWENGEKSGDRVTSGINFRFNIFNINFGIAVVI